MSPSEYNNFISPLPENQLIIVEELRAFIFQRYPDIAEKLAYGVPYYYFNKRCFFIWPTYVPRSGVKEDGVLLGFCNGHLMTYHTYKFRGLMNKIVRFVVYEEVDTIDWNEVGQWLNEAVEIDGGK